MTTWLVTGASRGIGLEMVRQLHARGDTVIATARKPDAAGALRELRGVRVLPLDVTDTASARHLRELLGDAPIDVLVNNAGIGGRGRTIAEVDIDAARNVLEVNTLGPLRVTQALLPNLRAGHAKKLAHITSLMGSIADNGSGGAYAYRASKAALNMVNKNLSLELGPDGFTCVVLNPGWVRTDMGGKQATLPVDESVRGLINVIDHLAPADNGTFINHDGRRLPW
ncbi:MAG TPA: SDR family oxidoreductase [Kofleriaceae bacterium]|jgi:NAD(P)-dependent dehydrogenase (short-subunit alcohol dehydrogenase family)|nr:SDR family oxidoreductase [Kofleriaceae bacterium]